MHSCSFCQLFNLVFVIVKYGIRYEFIEKGKRGGGGGEREWIPPPPPPPTGSGCHSELALSEVASLNFSVEMEKWAKSPVSLVHRWQKYLG